MSVLKKRRALLTNLDEENSKIQKIVQSKKASAPGGGNPIWNRRGCSSEILKSGRGSSFL